MKEHIPFSSFYCSSRECSYTHLEVGDEDELEDKNESDDGGTGGGEPKTCVDILLMHKVPKHEEDEKEVHLCMRERGRGGRVCGHKQENKL